MCTTKSKFYTHDCNSCFNLGTFEITESNDYKGQYDLYYCPSNIFGPTVVARYGNEGSEYYSYIGRQTTNPAMIEVIRRVDEKGWKLK